MLDTSWFAGWRDGCKVVDDFAYGAYVRAISGHVAYTVPAMRADARWHLETWLKRCVITGSWSAGYVAALQESLGRAL